MKKLGAFVLYGVALTAPGVTWAQATPQSGITYDCDTAADHFSELVLPTPGSGFTVSGELRVNQVPQIGKYIPLVRLSLAEPVTPGSAPTELVGFKLTVMPGKILDPKVKDDKLLVQFLNWDERTGDKAVEHPLFGIARSGNSLPFTLTYAKGKASLRIAGQQQDFALKSEHPVVRVVCSTGEFLITGLKIEASG